MKRFWSKVRKTNGCWYWEAGKFPNGYGCFSVNCTSKNAHRIAYELVKGKIPINMVIDHLCRTKSCVNPKHLEAVTCKENILRGEGYAAKNARKTRCVKGHKFKEHSYIDFYNRRICILCKRIAAAEYKKRNPNHARPYDPQKRRLKYLKWKEKHLS